MKKVIALILAMFFISTVFAQNSTDKAPAKKEKAKPMYGWRGNFTGLFPEGNPPTVFHRMPKGVTAGMTVQTEKPKDKNKKTGTPIVKGAVMDWLALGPFQAGDVGIEIDKEQVPGEANLFPAEGEKAGNMVWSKAAIAKADGVNYEWIDLSKDPKQNNIAYGFTNFWSDKDGKAEAVVEHQYGFKAWVNGKVVYMNPAGKSGFGNMYGFSRSKVALDNPQAASFIFDVKKGWNRFLVKAATSRISDWQVTRFNMHLADSPREYDDKNILWATPLPDRTNASPLIIGDKVYTVSEPDELICLDKNTGKILWKKTNSFFDAIPTGERQSNPAFKALVPDWEELQKTYDLTKSYELKKKILAGLVKADPAKYDVKWDGHMAAHFGIVGFTTQPVSDGKNIGVFVGNGIVACYDLNGNRKWINKIQIDMYVYTNSPVIVDNKLVVTCCGYGTIKNEHAASWIYAFDMDTGKQAWINKEAWGGIATLYPAKFGGKEVVITQKGDVLQGSDGAVLFSNPNKIPNDTGWSPAVVEGNNVVLPWGAFGIYIWDYSGVTGNVWKPVESSTGGLGSNKGPDGQYRDCFTADAPLVYKDIIYIQDQWGTFYAASLTEKKLLYRQAMEYEPYDSYDHLGCSSSPALCGKNIYAMDNQGVCIVVAPGPSYKMVSRNVIATQPVRDKWGIPMREVITNGSVVADGNRLYIRGQENMYCIGEK